MTEIQTKLAGVRAALAEAGLAGLRLRGVDGFAWATGGGNSAVLLTDEAGVAEVLVTATDAFALTDAIEAPRLAAEVVPPEFTLWHAPWQTPGAREAFVRDATHGGPVASDRPTAGEHALPDALVRARRRLLPDEVDRYRALGRDAAEVLTAVLTAARPDWTERDLAAHGSAALWARGIVPALILVGGERRVARYRHPVPTAERLGARALVGVCARRHGLVASLSRWVYFREPSPAEARLDADVRDVEAAALRHSRPGARLSDVYARFAEAYAAAGYAGEIDRHHQGGTIGYRAREIIASPTTETAIEAQTAVAWNPSLPGAKVEDTALVSEAGLEILTADPAWPTVPNADGLARPALLVRP